MAGWTFAACVFVEHVFIIFAFVAYETTSIALLLTNHSSVARQWASRHGQFTRRPIVNMITIPYNFIQIEFEAIGCIVPFSNHLKSNMADIYFYTIFYMLMLLEHHNMVWPSFPMNTWQILISNMNKMYSPDNSIRTHLHFSDSSECHNGPIHHLACRISLRYRQYLGVATRGAVWRLGGFFYVIVVVSDDGRIERQMKEWSWIIITILMMQLRRIDSSASSHKEQMN